MTEIKRLKFPFKAKGFTHELMERKGRVLLITRHKNGRSANLEVVVAKEGKAATFMQAGRQVTVPWREVYPSDTDWGCYGFTFRACDLDKARAKLEELAKRYPIALGSGQPDHNRQPPA